MLESLQEDQLEHISRPRWTIGNDGEQGKIVFPESFNGVIATEVNKPDLYCQERFFIFQPACHDRNTATLRRMSC